MTVVCHIPYRVREAYERVVTAIQASFLPQPDVTALYIHQRPTIHYFTTQ